MTDYFAEFLVKKNPTAQDKMKKGMLIAATLLVTALIVLLAILTEWYLIMILAVGIFYGAYYLLTGMDVEYEYTFTNGTLDIDKILGKRKRVSMISVETKDFKAFGAVTDALEDKPNATWILCSDNTGVGEYYADLNTDTYGETRIIFTPNERIVEYIEIALPRTLRVQQNEGK